jgi:N utilization substance protein B
MSSNTRHRAREAALQILYRYDVAKHAHQVPIPEGAALARDLGLHFEHFQVPQGIREFAAQLVAGTLQNMEQIDGVIEKHASNWKVSRMGFIDRNLLRMAVYEFINFSDIPAAVTIDEAIELAKQFGEAETPAFINGILDSAKHEKPEKNDADSRS